MKDQITTYLKFGNRFYGVEHTQINGEERIYGVSLKKKKKELELDTEFELKTLNELKAHIPKGKPISLAINTNAVLTKRVQSKANIVEKVVYQAFPNIKIKDFYFEVATQGDYQLVAICRRSYINDLLKRYASEGVMVIDVTLGNLGATVLSPFIDEAVIRSSNARITLSQNTITEMTLEDHQEVSEYTVNGLTVKNTALLSFASALNLFTKSRVTQSGFVEKKQELHTTYNQKRFASQFLKIGLSTLFLILLINFLFFNHYYNEVNTLRETAQVLEASKAKMISLNEKVQRTEKMVTDILKSSSSKSSFYANVIVNDLPESILLEEFNYQPLLKKIKEGKPIENEDDLILISGQTKAKVLFSNWVAQLEALPWIDAVNILSFEDRNTTTSKFAIRLQIKDDTKD